MINFLTYNPSHKYLSECSTEEKIVFHDFNDLHGRRAPNQAKVATATWLKYIIRAVSIDARLSRATHVTVADTHGTSHDIVSSHMSHTTKLCSYPGF